jgi:hypothetical protein
MLYNILFRCPSDITFFLRPPMLTQNKLERFSPANFSSLVHVWGCIHNNFFVT